MSAPLIKTRRRSPASLILETLGISQTKLAAALGVSKTTVTRMLAGTSSTSPQLEAVLRAVIGEERTFEVFAAIPPTPAMNVKVALERRIDPAAARELRRILFGRPLREVADEPAKEDQPESPSDDRSASSS